MKKIVILLALTLTACDNSAKVLECLDGCKGSSVEQVTVPAEPSTLSCQVFDLSVLGTTNTLPDMSALTPVTTLQLNSLNNPSVGETTSLNQLVGTPAESIKTQLGMVCTAKLNVEASGSHQFTVRSDDGARLSLNGIAVVNSPGLQGYTAINGTVTLERGVYNLKLEYFQNFGPKGLTLSVRRPGSPFEELIDSGMLK